MSQSFKLRFDQMRDGDPTAPEATEAPLGLHSIYPTVGYTRNLCLVWPDGRKLFANYAYLVAGEFEPGDETNMIRLSFSAQLITLRGYGLEPLFIALLDHLPRFILASDPRYVLDEDKANAVVIEMAVEKNE
ncbi:hypothetical protein [Spirosoma linguale]|uniref:Uncharacterized protein n=1 Tax=Spirosoma linguale (strain ATCC 33905 / DSM 74 / LMG 10896 / Claus 1) TaxID=504472 RepID=D2QCL5_SPILD|nr:hypothetical protein Slin_1975 [Spirosoma linguale DSM 74]